MNRTLQDRLVNELRAAGVTTPEAANAYLLKHYLPTHNEAFAREAADKASFFVEFGKTDLDEIFFEQVVRKVGKDNTVSVEGLCFQIGKQLGRRTCVGLAVHIRRHLDGRYTIRRGAQVFGVYEADGRPCQLEAKTSTHQDAPGATQRSRDDSRVVAAISTYRDSGRRARPREPASTRLRLPPADTRRNRAATKA